MVSREQAQSFAAVERGLARYPEFRFELVKALAGMASITLCYRSVNGLLAAEVLEFGDSGRVRRVLCHDADPS